MLTPLQNTGFRVEIAEGEDRTRRNIIYISRTSSRSPTKRST